MAARSFGSSLWRGLLAAALACTGIVAGGGDAQAGCVINGSTEDCTGDLFGGVQLNNGGGPITTLNVFGLTTDITSSLPGVEFTSDGPVTINVATWPWGIVTTGNDGHGIAAETTGASAININAAASVVTSGDDAYGIFALTDSGSITINSAGSLSTSGLDGAGIFATSTSGAIDIHSAGNIDVSGGLAAIFAGTLGAATVESATNIHTLGPGNAGIAVQGDAGASVTSWGSIQTEDDDSPAITVRADTGDITVRSHGPISTRGQESFGIDVMSITGAVDVISTSRIVTTGIDADGITAVSGSTVSVISRADIFATGDGAAAIRAAGLAGNQIFNYATAVGGFSSCGCGLGVEMMSATGDNTLVNYGSISALSGMAISGLSGAGNSMVENYGTVTGDVELMGASAIFSNHAGALFITADAVDAERVVNDGTISPGGRGTVQITALSNDFVQGSGGIYAVDLDPAASGFDRNDYLVASNTATVAGKVAVHLLSLPVSTADTFIIMTGMAGLTDNGLGLIASPALHATLASDSNNVYLGIAIDLASPDGLNGNQRAIAGNLNRGFVGGAGGIAPVLLGLLNVQSLGEYKGALDQLSPEIYSDAALSAVYSTQSFASSLLSCKVNGTDTASIIREGECLWAGASARFLDTGTTSDQIGFDETAGLFTAGAQVALDNVWRLGVAGGFQTSTLRTATGATSDGTLGQAGIALKYNPGPLLLAGAITGGGGTYDTHRVMSFGGFTGIAEGDQDMGIFSGTLRAAYVLGAPSLYFKPMLDATVTQLELGGFAESGSAAALDVESGSHTLFALTPAVETGTEWWLANGTLVRPLLRAGLTWYANPDFGLTSSFVDAPLGVSPFTINTNIDEVMGLVGAGVDVINGEDSALRLSYDGQLGETTQIHYVGIKGSARF